MIRMIALAAGMTVIAVLAGALAGRGLVDSVASKLSEEKKAELVLIACDVDPIELVMWMPALCRKMQVPFMVVKDKARLGALVHQKVASCVCVTGVGKEDASQLKLLQDLANESTITTLTCSVSGEVVSWV